MWISIHRVKVSFTTRKSHIIFRLILKITPKNDILAKCLDIVNQIVNKNRRTTTSIKIINDFSLDFTNSDFFKKKLSPSQRVRNLERHRIFLAKKHENISTGDISVRTEIKAREVSVQTFDIEKESNTENNTSNSEANTEPTSSKPKIYNRSIIKSSSKF